MSEPAELASLPIFAGVDGASLRAFQRRARVVEYPADAEIFRRGEPVGAPTDGVSGAALLVLSGRLAAVVEGPDGEREVGAIRRGEIVGESALFQAHGARSATVRAQRAARCLVIDRALMSGFDAASMALERHMLEVMSSRIRDTTASLEEVWDEAERAETSIRDGVAAWFSRWFG